MTLVGAKINGAIAPLSTKLQNGDVVEIVNRSNATPSLDWLEFVRSAHARSKLKAYFRKQSREQDAARGREALVSELKAQGLEPKQFVGDDKLEKLAKEFDSTENGQDLLAKIGSGLLTVQKVVSKIRGELPATPAGDRIEVSKTREGRLQLHAAGMKDVLLARAKCCAPIPGDEIVGYVSRGRGIMIHRRYCPHAMKMEETEPERLLRFHWPADGAVYSVSIKVVAINRQGLLMEVSTIFGESKTNVSAANIRTSSNNTAEIEATIEVTDTSQLATVMAKIANFSDVISVLRINTRLR
jgi:GTP pyrophosphokinase